MGGKIKTAVERLSENIRETPHFANAVFRVSTSMKGGDLKTNSEIRAFSIPMDEPRELGGDDTGPNPVEMVLAAFGSCQAIVYRAFATLLGIEIQEIDVHAKGHLDLRGFLNLAEVPAGFSGVTFTTRIVSSESTDNIRQLAVLVEKHCPVYDTLRQPVVVKGKVELVRPSAFGEGVEVVFETA